jgi:hypothetical protein
MRRVCKHICLLLAVLPASSLLSAPANPSVFPQFDYGCFASSDTSPDGSARLRVLGPLFERQSDTNGVDTFAARPFYCRVDDESQKKSLSEYLWPVGMHKEYGQETYWRFLCAFGHDFDSSNPESRTRNLIFPVVFWGHDKHGERYFAVFPLGGKLNEFLGRDRIIFAAFPLYAYSVVNNWETHSILWPLGSWSSGDGRNAVKVLPFYANSVNTDKVEKTAILWPIWTSAKYNYPDDKGSGFILFPLFGHAKLTHEETWNIVPPLFRWSRGEDMTQANLPYPFIQYSSGKEDKIYVWPVWGMKEQKGIKSWFLLAKLITGEQINRGDYVVDRFTAFPLIFNEKRTWKTATANHGAETTAPKPDDQPAPAADAPASDAFARCFKLWPLVSYERQEDAVRLKTLDLWPIRTTGSVERNLAPFWTLYSHVRIGGVKEDEVLWGLFRYRRDSGGGKYVSLFPVFTKGHSSDGEKTEWSFLKGLCGYNREGLRKTYRLLYFIKL